MSVKSRIIGVICAGALIAGTAVGLAAPASATANPVSITLTCAGSGQGPFSLVVSAPGVSLDSGDTFTLTNSSGTTMNVSLNGGASFATGASPLLTGTSATITATSSGGVMVQGAGAQAGGSCLFSSGNFGVQVAGGGGGSSSSAPAPIVTLTLAVSASGATCTGGNPSGVSGSWLTLPTASQCTQSGPTAKAGAVLLGWSTSANFPIARAQVQVDKKWGAIDETIDGTRMIFIPAGMATFVSGSNNLYPIWSK